MSIRTLSTTGISNFKELAIGTDIGVVATFFPPNIRRVPIFVLCNYNVAYHVGTVSGLSLSSSPESISKSASFFVTAYLFRSRAISFSIYLKNGFFFLFWLGANM